MSGFEDFHFLRPAWLAALLLLVPVAWLALRRSHASASWQRVCDPGLLRHLVVSGGNATSRVPLAVFCAGFVCACIAAAGPTWERLPTPTYQDPLQTVLVLSLADSMSTRDVSSSSRLVRARHKILDALEQVEGPVGLVIFAEEPYAVTPLTADAKVIAQQVPLLEPSLMPGRGAHLGRALDEAQRLLVAAGASQGRILLVGDGLGDDPPAALAAAGRSADAGFPVSVLGVGEDAEVLESLARAGDGRFATLRAGDADLESLLATDDLVHAFDVRRTRSDVQADTWSDAGAWLVLVPLLLTPLAFRRGWAAALGLLVFVATSSPSPARADVAEWFARPDQRAADAFDRGDHATAADLFEDPAWRGAAQYREGDFEAAIQTLQGRPDALSQYNLGNALARASQLEQALAAYDAVLEQEPEHEDAAFNRALVQEMLEQQRQQEQPPQESGASEQQDQPSSADAQQAGDAEQEEKDPGKQDGAGQSGEQQGDSSQQQQESDGASPQEQAAQSQEGSDSSASDSSASDAYEAEAGESEENPAQSPGVDPGEAATAQGESQPGHVPGSASGAPMETRVSESDQEVEQWLNRVPDDPGALLREKLRRRYVERRAAASRAQGAWR